MNLPTCENKKRTKSVAYRVLLLYYFVTDSYVFEIVPHRKVLPAPICLIMKIGKPNKTCARFNHIRKYGISAHNFLKTIRVTCN